MGGLMAIPLLLLYLGGFAVGIVVLVLTIKLMLRGIEALEIYIEKNKPGRF